MTKRITAAARRPAATSPNERGRCRGPYDTARRRCQDLQEDSSRIKALPGAVFFGTHARSAAHRENVQFAQRLQSIRAEYEADDCQASLWADCRSMGFDSDEISRFVANPAAITACGYMPAIALR
jgi:hypothetical protein